MQQQYQNLGHPVKTGQNIGENKTLSLYYVSMRKTFIQTIRETGVKIFDLLVKRKDQNIRQLADQSNCSKSSALRQIQAIERRNQHSESAYWETKVGDDWLRLLVFGALFRFGIRSGVGADLLSDFFKLIRIDSHVGVLPSALRTQLQQMEVLLPQFQQLC